MHDVLRQRLLRRIESLPEAQVYQVLDFIEFLEPRLVEAHRLLRPEGSFFLHIDYREAHYCKVLLDQLFGRRCFQNEIIWAYDYGARSKSKWSAVTLMVRLAMISQPFASTLAPAGVPGHWSR